MLFVLLVKLMLLVYIEIILLFPLNCNIITWLLMQDSFVVKIKSRLCLCLLLPDADLMTAPGL